MVQILFPFFLFYLCFAASGSEPWYTRVRQLSDESTSDLPARIKSLQADKTLMGEVCQAVHDHVHLTEALDASMRFNFQACWPEIFRLVDKEPQWLAVLTLEELHQNQEHPEWKTWLKSTVTGKKWPAIESPDKVSILSVADREGIDFTLAELKALFNDESSDVKVAVLPLLGAGIRKNPQDPKMKDLLKTTLTKSPLQFRLAAFQLIFDLPPAIKQELKPTIENCVKNEPKPRVRSVCSELQHSP